MLKDIEKLYLGGNADGKWRSKNKEASKFNRVAKIQKVYPEIDTKLRSFCSVEALSERKACAFAVLMMIETGIRIGNEDSAKGYVSKAKKTEGQILHTYGLTTLLKNHIRFDSDKMILDFIGKKSVQHVLVITDPFLVKVGHQFWSACTHQWLNGIADKDVNSFIKKSINSGFSAKDFRTFRANIEAARITQRILTQSIESKKKAVNEEIKQIIKEVSETLGNTPGIAKKAYINPEILRRHWTSRGFKVELQMKKGKIKEIIS